MNLLELIEKIYRLKVTKLLIIIFLLSIIIQLEL